MLSFATLDDTGRVAFASGAAGFLGGLIMSLWGGPRRLRMRGVLLCTLALGACSAVTGLRADLVVITVGAFGMALCLTLLNGIYATIVQVKVPQRFHGRVFALNTVISWSTLPIGFGLVAPGVSALLEPTARRRRRAGLDRRGARRHRAGTGDRFHVRPLRDGHRRHGSHRPADALALRLRP